MKILLAEDENMTRVALGDMLGRDGHEVTSCADGPSALDAIRDHEFDVVLTDLRLPRADGIEVLRATQARGGRCKVVIMTAYASTESAVQALRLGAYDYVSKPFQPDEILTILRHIAQLESVVKENQELRARLHDLGSGTIVGKSPAMQKLKDVIRAVAPTDRTVLIQGASGTGKEMVARAIHTYSARREAPFVGINCAAIPETLLESELFGHRKGSFTGADRDHAGYFERARGGTLFIDDIDDMPMSVQVKLLRVIQEREVEPVGGREAVPIDIRLVTATKADLRKRIASGGFREDLFYRLNVIPLGLPLLRERREDIPELLGHFLAKHGGGGPFPRLTLEDHRVLAAHAWPGNVRELENLVERWLAMPGMSIGELFDSPLSAAEGAPAGPPPSPELDPEGMDYREYMRECEQRLMDWALARCGGSVSAAAKLLRMPRSTLRSRLEP